MSQTKPFRYDKMFGDASIKRAPHQDVPHDPPPAVLSKAHAGTSNAAVNASQLANATVLGSAHVGNATSDDRTDPLMDETPPPPPPVPLFSPATRPILDTAGTRSIQLLWEAQRQTGLSGVVPPGASLPPCAIIYILLMQEVKRKKNGDELPLDDDAWVTVYQDAAASAEVCDLRPGRTYAFRVVVQPVPTPFYGEIPPQQPSAEARFATVPTPPELPEPARLVGRARNFLKFKWQDPEETGGRPITRYQALALRPGSGSDLDPAAEWDLLYDGPDNSHKLTSLRPGTRVAVKFKVFNEIGESEWSKPVAFTTSASVPDPPHGLEAVESTTDSIALHWQEPACNGDPISAYRLERDDGLDGDFVVDYHGPDRVHEASGLVSGRVYRFRVCASNEAGRGMYGPVLVATTAATPPMAPPPPSLNAASQTTAMLTWAPPANDGGSAVTGYTVELQAKSRPAQAELGSDWHAVHQGDGTVCTLRQLLPGCTYRVRVAAHNAAGQGAFSFPADILTAATSPNPPTDLQVASRSRDTLVMQWRPPAFDGGSFVVSYRLENRPLQLPDQGFSTASSAPETSVQIAGLTPGADYEFRVFAVNSFGQSPASDSLVAVTEAAPPLAPPPPQLDGRAAGDALKLSWQAPATRGCPVTGFSLQRCLAAAYLAAVEAEQQTGPASFALPQENGHGHYSVEQGSTPAEAQVAPKHVPWETVYDGKDACAKVRGMEPHTQYAFRVRAASDAGAGDWSGVALLATAAVAPSAPQGLAAGAANTGCLHVTWQPPAADHGAPVTGYQVDYALQPARGRERDAPWQTAYEGPELSCQVAGLRHGRDYLIRARAANSCGSGPWCEAACGATSPAAPDAPHPPMFSQVTATSVRAKWDASAEDNGAAILMYRLEVALAADPGSGEASWREVYSGAAMLTRAASLQPGRQYMFRLQAENTAGSSPYSPIATVTTAKPPPPPPSGVTAWAVAADAAATAPDATAAVRTPGAAIHVAWQPTQDGDSQQFGACASYEVQAAPLAGGHPLRQTCSARLHQCSLPDAQPGAIYHVCVRSVGAGGAGHGTWSTPAAVQLPAAAAPPVLGRGAASDAAHEPTGGKGRKKAASGVGDASGASESRARRRPTEGLEVRSSRALPPPAASVPLGKWLRRQWKQHRGLLQWTVLAVVAFALAVLVYSEKFGGGSGEPQPLRRPGGGYYQ